MPSTIARRAVLAAALIALSVAPATVSAQYLDPGAASIIVQAILAGVVAVGAGLKLYWSRISRLFSRRRRPDETD